MTATRALVVLLIVAACTRGEHRAPREKYNEGVDLLVKGDFEGAEKALLDARSTAGVDPELRFRAAYDLGMAYAGHAEKLKSGEQPDLQKALELTQQSVSWFSDAARLRKDDADTQANLATMRARQQSLADDLAKGQGKLEARLDALIAQQRTILDEARGAWVAIKQAGGADPLAQQATLTKLADEERGVVAEAGVIGDLSSEEIDTIAKKEEDKRTDEEKVRLVQLKNLELYLTDGRNKIAEARRKLQDLAAEEAVGRAEAALVQLKRAREQLLDPITVLREVARDELTVMQETRAVADATGSSKLTGPGSLAPLGPVAREPRSNPNPNPPNAGGPTADKPPEVIIPKWVEPAALADRQNGLRDRVEEVRARLAAAVDGPPPAPQPDQPPEAQAKAAEQAKVLARVKVALPSVTEASAAMDRARTALDAKRLPDATTAQREALVALANAIEQFADLKQTIDITSETQKQLVALLSPEAATQVAPADRQNETREGLAHNLARMTRIKELLVDETAKLAAQPPPKDDDKDKEAKLQQAEQMKQQMAQAETLRAEAEKLIGQLDGAIKKNKDPLTPAKAADAKLDELRRLFFSVIEHLQDLIRQQGETRDQTAAAHMEDDATRAPKLPNLVTRQTEHGQLAKAITEALASQADAATKAQDPQAQQQAKNMAAAADEVRLAQNDMTDAQNGLTKAQQATNQSVSLDPAQKTQATAIEHLTNALKLLQPPQQQDQKQDQQKQQEQQKQDAKEKKEQQQQQGGAGQRARDEDARRQRDRQQREGGGDTVEKDW